MTRPAMAGVAAAVAFAGSVATAEAAEVRATGPDGAEYVVGSSRDVERVDGRRTVMFQIVANTPATGSGPHVGGPALVAPVALAPRRHTTIGGYLQCTQASGGSFVFGTGGPGVRRVVAVFADGRRATLRRFRVPARWRYGGSVFLAIRIARVGLLEVRAYDSRGRRLERREYRPAPPCRTSGEPRPPEPTAMEHHPDPDIVTGRVAALRPRQLRRARIRDYDFEHRLICFCGPPARRWTDSRVRDGRPVGRGSATVRQLFRLIRDLIEDRPAALEVEYGRFGVPKVIDADGDLRLSDDETTVLVRRFRRR